MKTKLYTSILFILVLFSQCKPIGYFRKSTSSLLDPVNTFGLFLGLDKAGVSSNFITVTGIKTSINEGETQEVGVRLGSKPKSEITVKVASSDPAVTVNGGSSAELKFTPENYRTEQKVKLLAVEEEGAVNETVTVSYSSIGLETVSQTISVKDDLALIVTNFPASLYEGEAATVKVKLSKDIYTPKTVVINSNNPIVRIDGINSKTLYFTPQNAKIEQYVTLTGQIDNNSQYEVVNVDFVGANMIDQNLSLTMTDDLAIQIVNLPTSLYEGQSAAVGIKFNRQLFFPTTMNIVSNNPAVTIDGNSFRSLSFDATNGTIEQTVIIKSTIDLNTVNEVVTLSLSATGVSTVNRNLTVIDDLSVDLISMPTSIYEGETKQFEVRLSREIYDNVQVTLTSNIPAAAALNGTASINLNFDATNGTVPQTVNLTGVFDSDQNDSMAVTLSINGTGVAASSTTFNVVDNLTLVPVLNFSPNSLAEGTGGTANVTFNREIFANTQVVVSSTNPAITVNGGSSTVLNFAATTPPTIPAPQTVNLYAFEDNNSGNETVQVSFSSANLAIKNLQVDTVDGLAIDAVGLNAVMQEGQTQTFTVKFNMPPPSNRTVSISTVMPNVQFSAPGFPMATSLNLPFTNANTPVTVTVHSLLDNDSDPNNGQILISSTGVATKGLSLSISDIAILPTIPTLFAEEMTTDLSVGLNNPSLTDVTVTVNMIPSGLGTINGSVGTTTVTIPAGSTTPVNIPIYINNDENIAQEEIRFTFSAPGMQTLGLTGTDTVRYTLDNDAQNIILSGSSEIEEGSTGTLDVKLKYPPLTEPVIVFLNSTTPGSLGFSTTALYFSKSNYNVTQTVTLNALEESNKSSELSTVFANASGTALQTHNVSLIDNDVGIVITNSAANEGNFAFFNVTLNGNPGKDVNVTLTTSDSSRLKFGMGTDLSDTKTITFTSSSISEPIFFTAVKDFDSVNNPVTIYASGNGLASGNGTVTIFDSDKMNVEVSKSYFEIEENQTDSIQVRLTQQPSKNIIVRFDYNSSNRNGMAAPSGFTQPALTKSMSSLNQVVFTPADWDPVLKKTSYKAVQFHSDRDTNAFYEDNVFHAVAVYEDGSPWDSGLPDFAEPFAITARSIDLDVRAYIVPLNDTRNIVMSATTGTIGSINFYTNLTGNSGRSQTIYLWIDPMNCPSNGFGAVSSSIGCNDKIVTNYTINDWYLEKPSRIELKFSGEWLVNTIRAGSINDIEDSYHSYRWK